MNIIQRLKEIFFPKIDPLPVGMYHYQSPMEDEANFRYHLRLEPDGTGLLILNASTVLHLNQTAAEFAYYMSQSEDQETIAAAVAKRYHVTKETAMNDYQRFHEQINLMVNTVDLDPVTFFGFDRINPYSAKISAPYRMDIAVTYQNTADPNEHVAPVNRVKRELTTKEWQIILDKLWQSGIPHVNFTGGEPTLRPDLVDLIRHAENLGMVTGLLSDGTRLVETAYLHQILTSGLDYIMLLLDPQSDESWEALRDCLAEDISITVHLTLTVNNQEMMPEIINKLAEMAVPSISISTDTLHLKPELERIQQLIAEKHITLVWDIPVPYSSFNPVALETINGDEGIVGAGKAWLYVEPDGDVLEAQGIPEVLGNLLADEWPTIWNARQPRNV
jgi:organic radical activating enzyme